MSCCVISVSPEWVTKFLSSMFGARLKESVRGFLIEQENGYDRSDAPVCYYIKVKIKGTDGQMAKSHLG
jgi:hypothetical protein